MPGTVIHHELANLPEEGKINKAQKIAGERG